MAHVEISMTFPKYTHIPIAVFMSVNKSLKV